MSTGYCQTNHEIVIFSLSKVRSYLVLLVGNWHHSYILRLLLPTEQDCLEQRLARDVAQRWEAVHSSSSQYTPPPPTKKEFNMAGIFSLFYSEWYFPRLIFALFGSVQTLCKLCVIGACGFCQSPIFASYFPCTLFLFFFPPSSPNSATIPLPAT